VSALHAIDVTPPVSVGDLRDGEMWPYPDGYAAFKELSARGPDPITRTVPFLSADPPALSQAHAIALQWYLKALGEGSAPNRYISLWVAVETLIAVSGVSPKGGKRGNGPLARAFLEACGVTSETSADMWRARNIVHGSQPFESEVMQSLPMLSTSLKAVVAANLKSALGIPPEDPPIVTAAPFVVGGLSLGGQIQAEASDLD
jgi:hypothetical protein